MTAPIRRSIAVCSLVLLTAACTSSDASDTSSTSPPSTTASSTTTTAPPTTTTATTTSTTTTTTTIPETTTTTPVVPPAGVYGVVGCSNTDQAVSGYLGVSSEDRLTGGDLGGGSAPVWGDPTKERYGVYWGFYDERRPADGYDAAWVQLCLRTNEHGGAFDEAEQAWITHIVEQIQTRDPGIPVWVSGINSYGPGLVCESIGADGPLIAAQTADWATANLQGVSRGPDLGPLLAEHLRVRDTCHMNDAGGRLVGEQLSAFFD